MRINIITAGGGNCIAFNYASTKHTLECVSLIGRNEIVMYLPSYHDIYGEDEDEQVYIARIIKDNMGRLPSY